MADNSINITEGSGKVVDTKTVSSKDRQVVVLGDPSSATGLAPIDATNGLTVKVNSIASGQSITVADITTGTVVIKDNGGSITVDGSITVADITTGTVNIKDNGGSITVDFASGSLVNIGNISGGTISIPGGVNVNNITGGTIAIQDGGNSITVDGSVGITSISGGTIAISGLVNIGNITAGTISVSDVAHDSVDSGNPVKTGGKAYNFDGTVPGTAVAELDRANIITDLYGRQYVETAHPNYWSASENYFTAQGAGNTLVVNPGAGLKLFLTDLVISNGATAGTITLVEGLVDGTTTTKVGPFLLAVNGGAVVNLKTPVVLTANKSLGLVSQTVVDHSVTVSGFTSA